MKQTYAVDPRVCEHPGTSREYIGQFNTGDDQCYVCGLAMSKQMWVELRAAKATLKRLLGEYENQ